MSRKTILVLIIFFTTFPLMANEKIDSNDPCTVVLCMYGKLQGNNQSECRRAVRKFFSLRKFGSHGFRPWKTFIKRKDFLNGCPTADPAVVSDIMKQFGKMRG
ncbi:TrbM/KikA/MpfK family conjugal transfer protein [Arsenophonus apicola]|uniref:TrbM/KikA/MpfK family conjugal transfer protein n=1 Tax=Arsenophonus apicola TaxID=2879119 RepID=A0ABY8NYE5_9GAMM|nr:TrbM/KikA/MpfK family conjugal transfer protein [Arsenophonus apicola]WGO82270.1 TrbM/KikA/MpfK family conjugal transfer protein [Arsenophonus apicola]